MVNAEVDTPLTVGLLWSITSILAVVVLRSLGTLQAYSPASGTSVAMGVKLLPPSVERKMSTPPETPELLQLILVLPPPCTVPPEGCIPLIEVAGVTRRIAWFVLSEMKRSPAASTATALGKISVAVAAGRCRRSCRSGQGCRRRC